MYSNCISCGKEFCSTTGKKRSKRSISAKLQKIDKTVRSVCEDELGVTLTPQEKETRFLCQPCTWTFVSFSKSRDASRSAFEKLKENVNKGASYLAMKLRSPIPTPRKIKKMRVQSPLKRVTDKQEHMQLPSKKPPKTLTFSEQNVNRATNYLKLRQYKRGLELLLKSRIGARKAVREIVTKMVRKEMDGLLMQDASSKFSGNKSLEDWAKFTWDGLYEEIQTKCPMLVACLNGSCTSQATHRNLALRSKPSISIKRTIGTVTSILAYQAKARKMSNLQEINSLQMWLSSCKRQLFTRFNHLGLSVGLKGTRNTVDRLRKNFDSRVMEWRSAITDHLLMPSDTSAADTISYEGSDQPMSLDDTPVGSPLHSIDCSPARMHPMARLSRQVAEPFSPTQPLSCSESEPSTSVCQKGKPCFSICFDNVNQKTTVRHQTRDKRNKMFNMVQGYAALDRIPTLHLSDNPPTYEDILSIPLEDILPSEMDEVDLRAEMTIMVERILCKRVPFFGDLKSDINWHITHPFSHESSQKSETVLLGVLDKDESKVGDTIDILEDYHKYVPLKPDGTPLIIPLHADGLSCERANDAQNARLNGTTPWLQLQGLIPNIQEWHKRCLLLQDIYDELYSGKSSREKGTLFHLKNFFEQRNVTGNVKESFNYNEDFLEFCTEGYVTLLAMHLLGTEALEKIPEDFPEDIHDQRRLLSDIASKVIDDVFQPTSHIVQQILQTDEIKEGVYPFCVCKTEKAGEIMVFCDNRKCPRGVWFHIDCMDMDEDDIPSGAWFCSEQCKTEKFTKKKAKKTVADNLCDKQLNYALLLIWRGLSQMVRKDAIRENNGKHIIMHWKFDQLQFYAAHHPKYFLVCQRLLMAVNGGASPRLKHSLIWNRTVNVNGGKGKNISMDLQMEYFNKEYKGNIDL